MFARLAQTPWSGSDLRGRIEHASESPGEAPEYGACKVRIAQQGIEVGGSQREQRYVVDGNDVCAPGFTIDEREFPKEVAGRQLGDNSVALANFHRALDDDAQRVARIPFPNYHRIRWVCGLG